MRVPLDSFHRVLPPIGLNEIRAHSAELMAIRDRLISRYGEPVHFPWIPYGEGPIRTFQSYLTKIPRAAIALMPRLSAALDAATREHVGPIQAASELLVAERSLADAAGKGRMRLGQGRRLDQQVNAAVEALSMNAAIAYYGALGAVEDVHGTESFDLRCSIDGAEWRIEVKGTTTPGDEVLLTPNEVTHARNYPRMSLFVLAAVEICRSANGEVSASGGRARIYHPWILERGSLVSTGFRYLLPPPSMLM